MTDVAKKTLESQARRALGLMDLTALNDDDTSERIRTLCQQAASDVGKVAAVCIYPRFVPLAKKVLREQGSAGILVATVTNFPHGDEDIAIAVAETRAALAYGADEVDVVFPYRALMAGERETGARLVTACKQACGDKTLKVIIESGVLATPALIREASLIAIAAGADFIKTSTGKVAVNATLAAAEIMLTAIAETGGHCGFKAAGGVRSAADAAEYLQLAERILGADWVTPAHFRFGASSLLGNLLQTIHGQADGVASGGY